MLGKSVPYWGPGHKTPVAGAKCEGSSVDGGNVWQSMHTAFRFPLRRSMPSAAPWECGSWHVVHLTMPTCLSSGSDNAVGVIVGVLVTVGVFVMVGVLVPVGVDVRVGVGVRVEVRVGVGVTLAVKVGELVGLGVGVLVLCAAATRRNPGADSTLATVRRTMRRFMAIPYRAR